MILKFGVLDVPYGDAESYRETGQKKPKVLQGSKTTGDVAEILEAKYNIMEFFWILYGDKVGDAVLDSLEGAAESILAGASATHDPYGAASAEIESMFRDMLSQEKMNGQPGIATEAAKEGVSHRFGDVYNTQRFKKGKKKGQRKRGSRPSFIDTGLFSGAFRAWVDDE